MRIACAQFRPELGDLEVNRAQVERLAAEATGADLLVFPELASSGYAFASREEAESAAEPARDGPFAQHLVELARRHRMFLVAGLCERDGTRLFNSAILVGPDGVRGLYRKAHLFWDEKDIFTPGDTGLPVFDLAASDLGENRGDWTCRIGVLICFDWQFPEAWRVLALKGADLVCHPSNLVLPGLAQRAVPFHALLNRVFVVLANRYGTERHLTFTGESLLISPRGDELARAPAGADAILTAEIDPAAARDKEVTPRNDLLADRRPELYGEIIREETGRGRDAADREAAPPTSAPPQHPLPGDTESPATPGAPPHRQIPGDAR